MPEFLSSEWIRDLDATARATDAFTAEGDAAPLVVEQRVTGTPFGEVVYHLVIGREPRVVQEPASSPDVTLITDYDTACALHEGTLNAQHAIAAGRMKLLGHVEVLLRHADALRAIGDAFGPLRDAGDAERSTEDRR